MILCCVGESVAGNPTQFVMERTFAQAELDWRVITVDVASKDFPDAIAGIRAMKFSAVRFLPPFPSRAAEEFLPDSVTARLVGEVNTAMLTADGWQGWHALGYGIRNELMRRNDWSRTMIALVDDSVRCRSLLAALGEDLPQKTVWLNRASIPEDVLEQANVSSMTVERYSSFAPDLLESRLPQDCESLVIVGADEERLQQVQPTVQNLDVRKTIITSQSTQSLFDRTWEKLSELDELVAASVYNFERWTGRNTDSGLVRDAFDEYSGF